MTHIELDDNAMKKHLTILVALALALLPAAATLAAFNVSNGDKVILTGADHSTNGGAFGAYINRAASGTADFKTFCVELTSHVWLGTEYKVTLDPNSTTTGGALTERVASLYNLFLTKPTADQTPALQDAVQYSLWREMGYLHDLISSLSPSVGNTANQTWYDAWSAAWTSTGNFYGVQIMRLTALDGSGEYQDQLVQLPVPEITAATPEPTTLAIWGGLATLGLAVRAYRRQA